MNADNLHTQEGWLEDGLGAAETLVTDGDDLIKEEFFKKKNYEMCVCVNCLLLSFFRESS